MLRQTTQNLITALYPSLSHEDDLLSLIHIYTSYDDKEKYYRNLRNPWLFLLLMFALFAVTKQSIIFGIFVR